MAQATSSGGSPSQIIVGFDGSDLSMRALPVAHVLAQGTGDTIVLLEVVGNDNEIDEAKNDLAEPVNRLASTGVNVESLVVVGKPAERIIDVAGDRQARLIIMATHGRSGLGRWIYGSVADEVMRTSATPTVMIPTGFHPASVPPEQPHRPPTASLSRSTALFGRSTLCPVPSPSPRTWEVEWCWCASWCR